MVIEPTLVKDPTSLLPFLITDLKQNKRNDKQKGGRYQDT